MTGRRIGVLKLRYVPNVYGIGTYVRTNLNASEEVLTVTSMNGHPSALATAS